MNKINLWYLFSHEYEYSYGRGTNKIIYPLQICKVHIVYCTTNKIRFTAFDDARKPQVFCILYNKKLLFKSFKKAQEELLLRGI